MARNRILSLLLAGVITLISTTHAVAYPYADQQGTIYSGLQDLGKIARLQNLQQNEELGKVALSNLVERTLAPWKDEDVKAAFREFKDYARVKKVFPEELNRITDRATFERVSDIAAAAMLIVSRAIKNPGNMYFASGEAVGEEYVKSIGSMIERTTFLTSYDHLARGITISDADALFVPSDVFITNNLAEKANTASDQKTSSSTVPANTPVFIFGQIEDQHGLTPDADSWFDVQGQSFNQASDSWLVVWRPEFGLKFVRSRHIALADPAMVERYESLAKDNLEQACTERVSARFCKYRKDRLQRLTPVLWDSANQQHYMAASEERVIAPVLAHSINLQLYSAELVPVEVEVLDERQPLAQHLRKPDAAVPVTKREYLSHLHHCMFTNPIYSTPNVNRKFAWGAGIVGINHLLGQDVSMLSFCQLKSLGVLGPRHSWDQTLKGMKLSTVYDSDQGGAIDKQSLYNVMVDKCSLGNMASFGGGSLMICLGNLTVEQLGTLSPSAYAQAKAGGMQDTDRVPLVASSPVGFNNGGAWEVVPQSAVFPIFLHDASRSWVNRSRLYIYSYLTKPDHEEL